MKDIEVGSEVLVKTEQGKEEQGIFLESHEPGILLLKLKSGYNIGIKKKDIRTIKILKRAEKEKEIEDKLKHSGKNRIDLIITGGTISSRLDSKTGGVKPLTKPEQLLDMFPSLKDKADIRKIEVPFMKFSEDMDGKDWIKLAKIVVKSLNDKNCEGVVITHGTDTLHYTAAALSFFIKNLNKPIVLTYSQRSTDRGSSDSKLNLECSAYAALSDIAEVVIVGHASMNDNYCYALNGCKVRKMHTSRRDTFRPINCTPIAKIFGDGKIETVSDYSKRTSRKAEIDAVFNDKTALLKFYPGQEPDILNYYLRKRYKGLVIEMTGLGQVSEEFVTSIKKAVQKGMIICAAPQTLYGRLDPYVYSKGRELLDAGVIYLEDMLPETALVKLGWVLAHPNWKGKIQEKMLENVAGEFNKRLGKEFLE